MEDSVVDIQVSEAKELAWRISMTSRLQKLMGKQCVCLEYLMVRFFSHHKFEIIDSFIKIHVEISSFWHELLDLLTGTYRVI